MRGGAFSDRSEVCLVRGGVPSEKRMIFHKICIPTCTYIKNVLTCACWKYNSTYVSNMLHST